MVGLITHFRLTPRYPGDLLVSGARLSGNEIRNTIHFVLLFRASQHIAMINSTQVCLMAYAIVVGVLLTG